MIEKNLEFLAKYTDTTIVKRANCWYIDLWAFEVDEYRYNVWLGGYDAETLDEAVDKAAQDLSRNLERYAKTEQPDYKSWLASQSAELKQALEDAAAAGELLRDKLAVIKSLYPPAKSWAWGLSMRCVPEHAFIGGNE